MSLKSAIAAGHICLDIIPTLSGEASIVPGKLVEVGAAVMGTGGPVSNTGIPLHKLGIPTRLMGKVGDDIFGHGILDLLKAIDPQLAEGMLVDAEAESSYTVVISPPGVDRTFLHAPGANHTFAAGDVDMSKLDGTDLFHFGYPPLMKAMFQNAGRESESLFQAVKAKGITTSLDMVQVDPTTEAGQNDWNLYLAQVLPYIDIFLPSVEELLFMTNKEWLANLEDEAGGPDILPVIGEDVLIELGESMINFGSAMTILKLGNHGLYLRTSGRKDRIESMGASAPTNADAWVARELYIPCFQAEVVGTNGAGDCTIAGFLAAFLRGLSPEECMQVATATGACSVEAADATSGIPSWDAIQSRLGGEWPQRSETIPLEGWTQDGLLYTGPFDRKDHAVSPF